MHEDFSIPSTSESKSIQISDDANSQPAKQFERTKTNESVKESGLMGLKKKVVITNKYLVNWLNEKDNNELRDIKLEMPNQCTVQDCITVMLKSLNNVLVEEKKNYTLKEDATLYNLFISKKNGQAKTDYPPFDLDQKLNETSIMTFTLINKSSDVYIEKGSKPVENPNININNNKANNEQRATVVTFKANANESLSFKQKKETKTSKFNCLCFQWLFKKKSQEVLLDNTSQNNSFVKQK